MNDSYSNDRCGAAQMAESLLRCLTFIPNPGNITQ